MKDSLSFDSLIGNVVHVHEITNSYAKNAVNQLLTVRNWMIGYYIVEFEQNGENRAEYGTNLLERMAEDLAIKALIVKCLILVESFILDILRFARRCRAN